MDVMDEVIITNQLKSALKNSYDLLGAPLPIVPELSEFHDIPIKTETGDTGNGKAKGACSFNCCGFRSSCFE